MIHPNCQHNGTHNWESWQRGLYRVDGIPVVHDNDTFECAPEDMDKMRYYRRGCQNMGCDAVQLAEELEPAGQNEIIDRGGSEALYRKIP